jgi:p-hydroxybenzoate 3-monooxygenase
MMAYGQTSITEELYAARDAAGGEVMDEADNVRLHALTSRPHVTYEKTGASRRIDCDYVAGCDGFHGVSRAEDRFIEQHDARPRASARASSTRFCSM